MKKRKTMKKSQSTKYALVCSVLSLLLSISMLVGITYAWFTDSVSSGVTTIVAAGRMKVQLLDEKGNDIEGKTLQWITADESKTKVTSWNPGDTYKLQSFKIKNIGDLPLKYRIIINDTEKLNDYIEWSYQVDDNVSKSLFEEGHLAARQESDLITIIAHMKASLPNEFQNELINGIGITVFATQAVSGE